VRSGARFAPAGQRDPSALQESFAAAAEEFGVPTAILLSVAYNVSRWEHHGGAPSAAGGYGPMHLISGTPMLRLDGRGDGVDRSSRPAAPVLQTLDVAAGMLGLNPAMLMSDPGQNIRGGAALLASYARDTVGSAPTAAADWYGAVARYSGSS